MSAWSQRAMPSLLNHVRHNLEWKERHKRQIGNIYLDEPGPLKYTHCWETLGTELWAGEWTTEDGRQCGHFHPGTRNDHVAIYNHVFAKVVEWDRYAFPSNGKSSTNSCSSSTTLIHYPLKSSSPGPIFYNGHSLSGKADSTGPPNCLAPNVTHGTESTRIATDDWIQQRLDGNWRQKASGNELGLLYAWLNSWDEGTAQSRASIWWETAMLDGHESGRVRRRHHDRCCYLLCNEPAIFNLLGQHESRDKQWW